MVNLNYDPESNGQAKRIKDYNCHHLDDYFLLFVVAGGYFFDPRFLMPAVIKKRQIEKM